MKKQQKPFLTHEESTLVIILLTVVIGSAILSLLTSNITWGEKLTTSEGIFAFLVVIGFVFMVFSCVDLWYKYKYSKYLEECRDSTKWIFRDIQISTSKKRILLNHPPVFDDEGVLELKGGELRFIGKNKRIKINNVQKICVDDDIRLSFEQTRSFSLDGLATSGKLVRWYEDYAWVRVEYGAKNEIYWRVKELGISSRYRKDAIINLVRKVIGVN